MEGVRETNGVTSEVWREGQQPWDLPTPEPAAGRRAYLRERELALSHSRIRRENYDRYQREPRRAGEVQYLPIKLDIENVSRCNFRCTMCVVSDWPGGRRGRDMTLEEFRQLIDEQYGLVEIKLQGIGEPLMQGDALFEMIRYARAQHIWVRTATNASLLGVNDNYRKLIEADVNEVQISVDAAEGATFETIRRGSRFERVKENCRLINGYCREKGVVRTKMWTVVQRANEQQLEDLVDLAHALGFTQQVFEPGLTDWGLERWSRRNMAVSVRDHLARERLWAVVRRGEGLGVRVGFWNIAKKYSTRSRETLCPWPFERAVVTSDGRTVPCCVIGNPDAFELGRGKRFADVWRSEEYAAFRQAHLDGSVPSMCRGCYDGHSDGPNASCAGDDDHQ